VSRESVLSMRAGDSIESEIPLRGYLLSVGGALLLLLFAADWVLPAPLPSRLMESHSALPPIRINSELKGPEAVVIDTNMPVLMPMPRDEEIAAAPWQLQSSDVTDAAQQTGSPEPVDVSENSPAISTTSRVRESLAQLGPGVADQAGPCRRRSEVTSEPQRRFAQIRSGKRRRSARHPGFDPTLGSCNSLSRERGRCGYAFMPARTY
jgi:hypothetical protein